MPSGKSLTEKQSERLTAVVRELVAAAGSQDKLRLRAKEKGIDFSQQMVSHVHGGGRGGYAFAINIARYMGLRFDDLFGDVPLGRHRDLPDWAASVMETKRRVPGQFPEAAYEGAGDMPLYRPVEKATPQLVFGAIAYYLATTSEAAQAVRETSMVREDVHREPLPTASRIKATTSSMIPKGRK